MEQSTIYDRYVQQHRWCRSDVRLPLAQLSNEQLFFATVFRAYPTRDFEWSRDYAALSYALMGLTRLQRLVVTEFFGLLGETKLKRAGICRKHGLQMRDVKAALKGAISKLRQRNQLKRQLFFIFADEHTRFRLERALDDEESCGWIRRVQIAS